MRLVAIYLSYQRRYKRVMAGRSVASEVDVAMLPVEDSEVDSLELFSATEAARSVVVKMKKKAERMKERRPSAVQAGQTVAASND